MTKECIREADIGCDLCECSASLSARNIPDEESIFSISDLFKIFGDTTRLRILLLLEGGPMCGSYIAEHLGMTKPAVSYQLKMLRRHDLVRSKREGKNIIYRISDDHVRAIINCAIEHVNE